MEATFLKRNAPVSGRAKLLGTRRGTLIVAGGCALLAGAILLVFLQQYRDSVAAAPPPLTVLVADQLIPKGTSGSVVTDERLFKQVDVPVDRVKEGALTDAAALQGKVAVADVYPGEQVTAEAFARGIEPVRANLTGDQRVFSVPLDGAHGVLGHLRRGDHVDVLAGFVALSDLGRGKPMLRTLMQDVLVLDAPTEEVKSYTGSKKHSVALRVTDRQAAQLAFAVENGKVWLTMRPTAGATSSRPSTVALESLLADTKPIATGKSKAGR
jgi:Flp pilus assembly protein CpaB